MRKWEVDSFSRSVKPAQPVPRIARTGFEELCVRIPEDIECGEKEVVIFDFAGMGEWEEA